MATLPSASMRVVAGTARGRRLRAPKGHAIRPTSDRVRESIFNSLDSMDAVQGTRVADLFAGTGALGIEALSRGAASATFVDDDRAAIAVIRDNLAATGLAGPAATVVQADAIRWASTAGPVDLAVADPPYAFDRWGELLGAIRTQLLVCETARDLPAHAGWDVVRHKRYGSTVVTVLKPTSEAL
jgi:16S rRNA (guanine966-N2)-methyltransferase